jgi:hypothetical protein
MPSNWMQPISYKTFSNMLLQKNKVYDDIITRNGKKDPLHKTLLIIDEAHKLYSPGVAASEQPDTDILEKMIQNSYKESGSKSVRVLLMTATPYTEDAMELIKLLNLLRPKNLFPINFREFTKSYLDNNGYFTESGRKTFLNQTSGYVSYLNRSQDARNFAHPVFKDVVVPLSAKEEKKLLKVNRFTKDIKELSKQKKELSAGLKQNVKDFESSFKNKCKEETSDFATKCKADVSLNSQAIIDGIANKKIDLKNKKTNQDKKCMELKAAQRKQCKELNKSSYDTNLQLLKESTEKHKLNIKEQIKDCSTKAKGYSEKCKNKMNEGKNNILSEVNEIKDKIIKKKVYYKTLTEAKKMHLSKIKEARGNKKDLTILIKANKEQIKELRKKDNIKPEAENKIELKKLRENLKSLTAEKNVFRDFIVKTMKTKDYIGEEIGTKLKQDTSQEKALYDVCKL